MRQIMRKIPPALSAWARCAGCQKRAGLNIYYWINAKREIRARSYIRACVFDRGYAHMMRVGEEDKLDKYMNKG